MNKIILYGNTGKDPEVKRLESGKIVAKFSLATSRRDKGKTTDWHNIVVWDKLAELIEKYVPKRTAIIVEGELQYRNYENKDGIKVYITEIIGREVHFTGKKETETPVTENKSNKIEMKALSDISELPGNIDDGNIPDDTEAPF